MAPRQPTKRPSQEEQSRAFVEKARELGADQPAEDDEVMRRLAQQKRRKPSKIKQSDR